MVVDVLRLDEGEPKRGKLGMACRDCGVKASAEIDAFQKTGLAREHDGEDSRLSGVKNLAEHPFDVNQG